MSTPENGQGVPQEAAPAPGTGGGNGVAIAGLVIAIIALLASVIPFAGLAVAVLALVLSIMGTKKAGLLGGAGKGAAVAGIVIAIIGILLGGATTACGLLCGAAAGSAVEMQKDLDTKAKAAGHADFQAWQQADPEGAARASAEAASKWMGGFGIDTSELDKAFEEAAERAADAAPDDLGEEDVPPDEAAE